ncbi:hypothetical protein GCK32_001735 [Trichostrongylus colubriformis]|uniref:Uncharacterized protein n=1 Tax=Trichostrongylus colubriformis TaxID=6319 RepID=A0AAN8FNE7_TRICO
MPAPPQQIYYCRIRNCQRTCGLVHRDSSRKKIPPLLNKSLSVDNSQATKEPPNKVDIEAKSKKKRVKKKVRGQRSISSKSSTSVSNGSSAQERSESQNDDGVSYVRKRQMSTFEEIMIRAVRKTSNMKIEDTSPSPSLLRKSANEKRMLMAPSVSLDTTTIHFDQPVWDNPELREQLLDSEEEFALDGTTEISAIPPVLKEDSLIMDDIISETTHAVDYNPIDHNRQDEMISGWSSDDNDYTTVDLSQVRKNDGHDTPVVPVRRRAFQDARYEPSLDIVDHT